MLTRYITALFWLFVLLWLTRIGNQSPVENQMPDIAYYIVALFIVWVLAWPEWILAILQFKNKNVKEWTDGS